MTKAEHAKLYRQRHKAEIAAYAKRYRVTHKEQRRAYQRLWLKQQRVRMAGLDRNLIIAYTALVKISELLPKDTSIPGVYARTAIDIVTSPKGV